MQPDMSRVGRRIRQLRNKLGLKQAAFGRLVGVDQSTVSRWESDTHPPEGEPLLRLARLAGTTVEEFLGESELKPRDVKEVLVIGRVQAGVWVEHPEFPEDEKYPLAMPTSPKYRSFPQFALEVVGPSMNEIYPEGSVILCVKFDDLGRGPQPEERVVVQRYRKDGLVEVTVKEWTVDDQGRVWLMPRSTHPEYRAPMPLPHPEDGNGTEDVKIWALVIGRFIFE